MKREQIFRKSFIIAFFLVIGCLFLSYNSFAAPVGRVVGKSECKDWKSRAISVEYKYTDGILLLEHRNVTYNCCMEKVLSIISVKEGKISIFSKEGYGQHGPCDCLCPFDIKYEIRDLSPNAYTVTIDNTKAEGHNKPIQFIIDLNSLKSGKHHVEE